ncbi:mRNA capping enzyme [Spraguea lophii 42_110]|uniref:mRNA cap guanine-N(7) methyltransferase n=1 Tax=Spraguea lophii (strain 42_110) TaxID=1358809 RepID=S7WDY4_SPRLO|nr:mRNA capping enzyme [Spraguea lophii 42_110]
MSKDKRKLDASTSKRIHTTEIAEHYNSIKSINKKERTQSKIINIRNMNNFIKSILIKKYTKADNSVLDIGCGKGGDIFKFAHQNIKYYTGIDIAENSIEEAKQRCANRNIKFNTQFLVQDYTQKFNYKEKYDVISAQFTYHYSFFSEQSFQNSLCNILQHTKIGSYVIMSIPDKETIVRRYKKYGNGYGNEYYKITFKKDNNKESKDDEDKNDRKGKEEEDKNDKDRKDEDNNKKSKDNEDDHATTEDKNDKDNEDNNITTEDKKDKDNEDKHITIEDNKDKHITTGSNGDNHITIKDNNITTKNNNITTEDNHITIKDNTTKDNHIINNTENKDEKQSITNKNNTNLKSKEPIENNDKDKISTENNNINLKEIFGVEYYFKLEEAVEECPEYLVDLKYLIESFGSKKLKNIMNLSFMEFYNKYSNEFIELKRKMIVNRLNMEEVRVMELYRVLVFQREE